MNVSTHKKKKEFRDKYSGPEPPTLLLSNPKHQRRRKQEKSDTSEDLLTSNPVL
jgi:hypothetical protein